MLFDGGMAVISRRSNTASAGDMPVYEDVPYYSSGFGNKSVGISRFWTAKANDRQADLLIEVHRNGYIRVNDRCTLESFKDDGLSGEYEIIQVQHVLDEDGLEMSDLTLERVEDGAQ